VIETVQNIDKNDDSFEENILLKRLPLIEQILSRRSILVNSHDLPALSEMSDEDIVEMMESLSKDDFYAEETLPEYRRVKKAVQLAADVTFPYNASEIPNLDESTFVIPNKNAFFDIAQLFSTEEFDTKVYDRYGCFNVGFGIICLNIEALQTSWQSIRQKLEKVHGHSAKDSIDFAMSEYIFFDLHYVLQHEYTHSKSTVINFADDGGIVGHCGLQRTGLEDGDEDEYNLINELLTNFFAYRSMMQSPNLLRIKSLLDSRIRGGFDYNFGEQLERLVGKDVLEHAYFLGDPELLERSIDHPLSSSGVTVKQDRYKKLLALTDKLEDRMTPKQLNRLHQRIMQVIKT
jgi:hypothetical protein